MILGRERNDRPGGTIQKARLMRLKWENLGTRIADEADTKTVEIDGFAATPFATPTARRFILTEEPGCCPGCFPRDGSVSVEVFATAPIPLTGDLARLTGQWRVQPAARGQSNPGAINCATRVCWSHRAGPA